MLELLKFIASAVLGLELDTVIIFKDVLGIGFKVGFLICLNIVNILSDQL
jgi:hypothetical protein